MELYVVVHNGESYSVWPANRALPPGWRATSEPASRDDCLGHVERVWSLL